MKLSELIARLAEVLEEHGDIHVRMFSLTANQHRELASVAVEEIEDNGMVAVIK